MEWGWQIYHVSGVMETISGALCSLIYCHKHCGKQKSLWQLGVDILTVSREDSLPPHNTETPTAFTKTDDLVTDTSGWKLIVSPGRWNTRTSELCPWASASVPAAQETVWNEGSTSECSRAGMSRWQHLGGQRSTQPPWPPWRICSIPCIHERIEPLQSTCILASTTSLANVIILSSCYPNIPVIYPEFTTLKYLVFMGAKQASAYPLHLIVTW